MDSKRWMIIQSCFRFVQSKDSYEYEE